jgi:hypothetical protein
MSEHSRLVLLADTGRLGGKRSALGVGHRPPPLALPSKIFQPIWLDVNLESHASLSAAVLIISRVGAANKSSGCLRSIYFPLGMPSFIGRRLTLYVRSIILDGWSYQSNASVQKLPSRRARVLRWGRLYHQGETQLDDSRLKDRR